MKKILLATLLLASTAHAQLPSSTADKFPVCDSFNHGKRVSITDATDDEDCDGGGAGNPRPHVCICWWNGSTGDWYTSIGLSVLRAGDTMTGSLFITGSASLGVGTVIPLGLVHISAEASSAQLFVTNYGTDLRPTICMYNARGTESSPTNLESGDLVGQVSFQGFSTARVNGARIRAVTAAQWGTASDTTDAPTDLVFQTVQDGSGDLINRVIIQDDGLVGIGNNQPDSLLHIGEVDDASDDYLQVDSESGAPPSGDCDADTERGRMILDHTNDRLYVCNGATRGWDHLSLTD